MKTKILKRIRKKNSVVIKENLESTYFRYRLYINGYYEGGFEHISDAISESWDYVLENGLKEEEKIKITNKRFYRAANIIYKNYKRFID